MICPRCGSEVPEKYRFCGTCGVPIDCAPHGGIDDSAHTGSCVRRGFEGSGFVLSLIGLIVGFFFLCIPGLVLSILGFERASSLKKRGAMADEVQGAWIVGIVGIVSNAFGVLLQVLAAFVLSAIVASGFDPASAVEEYGPLPDAPASLGSSLGADIDGDEFASDLSSCLADDLHDAGLSSASLEVADARIESTTPPREYSDGACLSRASGTATVSYNGASETVDIVACYYRDDASDQSTTWFIYDYSLSSYGVFPDVFQDYVRAGQADLPEADPASFAEEAVSVSSHRQLVA